MRTMMLRPRMMMMVAAATVALMGASAGSASGQDGGDGLQLTPAPENARAYIVEPATGEVVTSPVKVVFGLMGMGVAPAGVEMDGTGHHHLLVDRDLPPLNAALPATEHSIHFGGGQTETMLDLAPGEHTLQLLLADWRHVPHDPPVASETVTITVE